MFSFRTMLSVVASHTIVDSRILKLSVNIIILLDILLCGTLIQNKKRAGLLKHEARFITLWLKQQFPPSLNERKEWWDVQIKIP